jgi:hypothetical protein
MRDRTLAVSGSTRNASISYSKDPIVARDVLRYRQGSIIPPTHSLKERVPDHTGTCSLTWLAKR